jgi:hypothetical protein
MIEHPALPFLKRDEKGKVVSAADAVKLIRDGDTPSKMCALCGLWCGRGKPVIIAAGHSGW